MSTALLRVRQVLQLAGLPTDTRVSRVESARNEVWLTDQHVVRIASSVSAQRLTHEAQVVGMLPADVPHPGILASGRAGFGEWSVLPRIHSAPLAHLWPDLNDAQRFGAVLSIARALRAIHSIDASSLHPPFLSPGSLECSHQLPVPRLMNVLDRLRGDKRIDRGLLTSAELLALRADDVLGPMPSTLVHGDFHLENVLFGQGFVRAVVDFEFARASWPEIDLEVLLRFCDEPQLHVSSNDARRMHRDDFKPVVTWLREGYPELFEHPKLVERVNLCSLSYDLRDLVMFPPDRPAKDLPPFHPINRLARLLDGRGLLQLIEW
ncbi:MAG: phosphotransferase family protein [Acidimicrobiia bacterium]